jgi:myo-inositol-1(or 4)-monophosphatase
VVARRDTGLRLPAAEAEKHLEVARRAATLAVERVRKTRDRAAAIRSEQGRDIKIEADYLLDELITRELRARSPFGIISEEVDGPRDPSKGSWWIVDPLDGSFNFHRGIPFCCVSIALWVDGAPVVGIIREIDQDLEYCGIVGDRATVNGRRMRVSAVARPESAVLCTGFPTGGDLSPDVMAAFAANVRRYKKVRLIGSAALSLAYVAGGRVDAYQENSIGLWDVAAGIAIVLAAGGQARWAPAGPPALLDVCATNAALSSG